MMNQSFSMYSGDSKKIYVEVIDPKGTKVNLTGSTVIWVLQQRGIEVLRKTSPVEISLADPTKGKLVISMNPEDTKGRLGDYTHIMQITDSSGAVHTVLNGNISLMKGIINTLS